MNENIQLKNVNENMTYLEWLETTQNVIKDLNIFIYSPNKNMKNPFESIKLDRFDLNIELLTLFATNSNTKLYTMGFLAEMYQSLDILLQNYTIFNKYQYLLSSQCPHELTSSTDLYLNYKGEASVGFKTDQNLHQETDETKNELKSLYSCIEAHEMLKESQNLLHQAYIIETNVLLTKNSKNAKKSDVKEDSDKNSNAENIKKLKRLLLTAKKHNDSLKNQISTLQLTANELEKYKKERELNENAQIEQNSKLTEDNVKLTKQLQGFELLLETKIQAISHQNQRLKCDLELELKKNSIFEERLKNISQPTVISLPNSNAIDDVAERQRFNIKLDQINAKYEESLKKVITIESERNSLSNTIDEMEIYRKQMKFEHEQEILKLTQKRDDSDNDQLVKMKIYEEEIANLKNEINQILQHTKMNNIVSAVDNTSPVNIERVASKISINETNEISENYLEKIMNSFNITDAEKSSELPETSFFEDLIESEAENNLLREQMKVLKEEIRRLDIILKTGLISNESGMCKLITQFITGDVFTKKTLLPSFLSSLDPGEEEKQLLCQFAELELKGTSTIYNLVDYMTKWI